jgi:hypothetical protein
MADKGVGSNILSDTKKQSVVVWGVRWYNQRESSVP